MSNDERRLHHKIAGGLKTYLFQDPVKVPTKTPHPTTPDVPRR
jgi:hypothetical protein